MASTKKPSGLSIARNNFKFTISWKIADANYTDGQQLQYRILAAGKWSAWTSVTIGVQATTASVTKSAASYYPTTTSFFRTIAFRIRGRKKDCDWSDWAEKALDLYAPAAPSVSAALDGTASNKTTFSWSAPSSATDNKPYHSVEWQTILVKECNETDGSKLSWKSSTLGWATSTSTSTSGTIVREEETTLLAAASYTRWVRIRSRGAGANGATPGRSAWKYSKHVYARPYQAVINSAKLEHGNWIRVNWTAASNASHPIDFVEVDYAIGTPRADLVPPVSPSWNTALTFYDTKGTDEAFFQITDAIDYDECLWVRVNVHHDHDGNSRASDAALVACGALTAPTNLSVVTNDSTYMATVTATNNSSVPDSELAIVFRKAGCEDIIVGYIAHGSTSETVQCPNWSDGVPVEFGVFAYQGWRVSQIGIPSIWGNNPPSSETLSVDANMKSATLWAGGAVPLEPSNVLAVQSDTEGEVILTWGWAWQSANRAEISWSDNPNAWESTAEPSTYMITNLNTAKWRVSGLEVGKTWYFRVRLAQETEGGITYGPYCNTVAVDLSTAPAVPVLTLSKSVVQQDSIFRASWTYQPTDGSQQAYAELVEVTYENNNEVRTVIAHANTEHFCNFRPMKWNTGTIHDLSVRVTSESGQTSGWSDIVSIAVADPLSISISQTSLAIKSIDDGAGGTRAVLSLADLPMTITITGAGAGGTTSLVIERAATYVMDRPDEDLFSGYEGEAVYKGSQNGEAQMIIDLDDLTGSLDDGAQYRLIATISDGYGQSDEAVLDFEVHWDHQALMPEGTVAISDGVAIISPEGPVGYTGGDTCDVYRLSADKPVLVLEGVEFDEDYVDPYPTIGEHGGYRLVYRTATGDYITADDTLAWLDIAAGITDRVTIIDFDGNQVVLPYNLEISSNWKKEFVETTYLGGSIQGDWNLGVHRNASIGTQVVVTDPEIITMMRRLAVYPGICHVRTPDGSSYAADVQISEVQSYDRAGKIAVFDLTITRVDTEGLDGVPYDLWAPEGATGAT